MPYVPATNFALHSVDHDQVLFDKERPSVRHLVGESEELVTPEKLTLSFTLDGEQFSHELTREKGSIAAGAELIILGDNGESETVQAPQTFAYYNADRSTVLTFQEHNRFEGLIVDTESGSVHHFVGKDGELKVDAAANDFLKGDLKLQARRGLSEAKAIDVWTSCYPGQTLGTSTIDVGGAIGYNAVLSYGATTATNYFNSYITLSNSIYTTQMNVVLNVATIVAASSSSSASWANSGCTTAIDTQLNQLRTWSKPSTQDIWHLLDDCFGSSGNTLGIAYVGVLCASANSGVSYMSEGRISTTDYPTWATVAHEIGHNFDAQHSFEEGQGSTGGIMDYGPINNRLIDGDIQFNTQYRRSEVCSELTVASNNGCLALGTGGSPVGSPVVAPPTPLPTTNPPTSCPWFFGCNIEVTRDASSERDLSCVKRRNMKITSGENLSEAMGGYTLSQCRSACAADSKCVSFSFNERLGYCSTEAAVLGTTHVTEYDTYVCDGQDISETVDDILDLADAESLMNQCCKVLDATAFTGMNNRGAVIGDSMQMCQAACVLDSTCGGVMYDKAGSECLFFGSDAGVIADATSSSMVCNRECISEAVGIAPVVPATVSGFAHVPEIAAGLAAAALVAVAAVLIVVRNKRADN